MPFVKGDPNINRRGRPKKGHALTDVIKKALEEEMKDKDGNPLGMTFKQAFARTLVARSIRGDMNAARLVLAYIDGMPTQKIQLEQNPVMSAEELDRRMEEIERRHEHFMDRATEGVSGYIVCEASGAAENSESSS